ncbi:sigma-70 family RNA polymerase sigma factor [Evansella cellulosilytica]|uniref:RNA polymerase, sigma-24 subunit, ECF subfamily n=1 Tax=Evansella cellulosilytica (strain ATCC 21833 / DSM 2522 / FERM P-1141 / JCM 9156 / N-4) TaxID=649639 RepID=E6U0S4_EVAC2|nr:sigma-70 family RNA polymerase sigma factor [Evansella cellulosilytica]ADU29122.1 RNA polymerase, sigma-24 subunit, ECF subfamily [Evansella cellulosilytica DSM 2522]
MNKEERDQFLEEVMVAHGSELVRLAFTYVKNIEAAKDLVQNTFIKCYERIDHFRYEAQIKTWLYRITINECKDYLKSWSYRTEKAVDFLQTTVKAIRPSVEEEWLVKSDRQQMKRIVLSLPTNYREVIYLYYYQSLKIEEIATVCSLNENTVKTRLRRAKQKLKEKLEEVHVHG